MPFAPDPQPVAQSRRFLAGALILFMVLTAVLTYPQVLRMRDGVDDVGDPLLNTWTLAWVAHQLPFAPAHLFDANIFYPERRTLAFSEALLLPGLVAAPLLWAGAGPIFAYNIVFLAALVFSGLGTTLLVYELTGEAGAAIVGGIIFAFLPFRMAQYSHMQLQQTQFIPMTMWALHRVMRSGRLGDGVMLGVFAACQMLSCLYFGIFLIPYVAVVALVLLLSETRLISVDQGVLLTFDRPLVRRRVLALGAAGAVCLALVAPEGRAYAAARRVVGERSASDVVSGSATLSDYLATADTNALYGRWSDYFGQYEEHRLFPGVLAVVLALVALWPPVSRVRLAYGVALLLAFDMSFGFSGLTYRVLWNYVLPFRALRVPARMGLMVGFSLAVLAGYGVARLSAAMPSKTARSLLPVALSLLILLEYRSKPLQLTTVSEVPPPVYADLLRDRGDAPDVAIVELPISREDPTLMYYSTFHWQNLLNGYSGFSPPSFSRLVQTLASFPDQTSLLELRRRGTRYVVIHGELLGPDEYAALVAAADRSAELNLVVRRPWAGQEISLYRLTTDR
jgi:hypothetical protein